MYLKFTPIEREVLASRLTVPDCISEALTDVFPGDPEPTYSKHEVDEEACKMLIELESSGGLSIGSDLARDILEDVIDGSTMPYFLDDAVVDGDMSVEQVKAYRRAFRSIERKAARAGVHARFS